MAVHKNNARDITSVSIHPSGVVVAVCDEDGIKLCDVCDSELAPADWSYDDKLTDTNGLRLRAVLPTKNAAAVRFSHGRDFIYIAGVRYYSHATRFFFIFLNKSILSPLSQMSDSRVIPPLSLPFYI